MSAIKRSQYKQQPVNPQIRIDYLNHFSSCTWRPVWRTSDCQRKVQKHAFLFCNSTLGGQNVAFVWPGFLPRIACLTSQTSVSLKTEIMHLFEYFYNPAHTCQVSALSLSLFVCVCVCETKLWFPPEWQSELEPRGWCFPTCGAAFRTEGCALDCRISSLC